MAAPKTALISVDEICREYLLKREKTMHAYYKVLPLACEAVQELTLTGSMEFMNHVELTKEDNESWFVLPEGFVDWVNVGLRFSERWVPIGVSTRLIDTPATSGSQGFNEEYNGEFEHSGEWEQWKDSCGMPYYGFNGGVYPWWGGSAIHTDTRGSITSGFFTNVPRPDEVTFNVQKGIIMCPNNFPSNKLYLIYTSVGTADTMTYIPVKAQACVEAYIAWKYALNRRGGIGEAKYMAEEYNKQHRLLRARNSTMTPAVVRRIFDRGYMIGIWGYEGFGYGCCPCPPSGSNISSLNVVGIAGTEVIIPIGGLFVTFLIIDDIFKNTGFTQDGNVITFTDGTILIGGEKITLYFS